MPEVIACSQPCIDTRGPVLVTPKLLVGTTRRRSLEAPGRIDNDYDGNMVRPLVTLSAANKLQALAISLHSRKLRRKKF